MCFIDNMIRQYGGVVRCPDCGNEVLDHRFCTFCMSGGKKQGVEAKAEALGLNDYEVPSKVDAPPKVTKPKASKPKKAKKKAKASKKAKKKSK